MGKLMDILKQGEADTLRDAWDRTDAAEEFGPLPRGEYVAHIIAGELENSRSNATPGYKLSFRVCEGEYAGRQFWHDLWLTEAALPMTKRDLAKLGVTSLDQLENPLPRGIRCVCKVVLQRGDDGAEYNRVRTFTVVGIDEPEPDAFAPSDGEATGTPSEAASTGDESETDGTPF
jgi:hypothetical protein